MPKPASSSIRFSRAIRFRSGTLLFVANAGYPGPVGRRRQHLEERAGRAGDALAARAWSPNAQGYAEFMDAVSNGSVPANAAVAYSLAGNRDKAFEYLEKAFDDRDDEITAVIRFPAFDSLKSDPRWPALLHKLNLPQ